jgi:hypothetical protein
VLHGRRVRFAVDIAMHRMGAGMPVARVVDGCSYRTGVPVRRPAGLHAGRRDALEGQRQRQKPDKQGTQQRPHGANLPDARGLGARRGPRYPCRHRTLRENRK